MENRSRDQTQWLRAQPFQNMELMSATFTSHVFPRHFHETYVIEMVEAGVDEFHCGDSLHHAGPGSIILINPGDVHTGRPVGSVPLRYRSFYPGADLFASIVSQLDDGRETAPLFPNPVIRDQRLYRALSQLHRACATEHDSLGLETLYVRTFSTLIRDHSNKRFRLDPAGREHIAIKRTKDYLLDNYSKSITLNELTGVSRLSPYHTLRAFKKTVGIPPYAFLISVRVARAKELLKRGEDIAQVAQITGFYDQSHLNRHFKRIVGVTPGQYHLQFRP